MHSPTTRAIAHYAKEALQQNDPMHFLDRFSPLHNRWHTTSLRNNLGFLLFHWYVIQGFKKCHADRIWPGGIHPFTAGDWSNRFDWPYNVSNNVAAGDYNSLGAFSSAIESWHNEAHMAVEMVTGENMMDPLNNIYLKNFWRLHYFIDARFVEALQNFDGSGSVAKQVGRIVKKYHGRLGEV